jgi:hypothetical protein
MALGSAGVVAMAQPLKHRDRRFRRQLFYMLCERRMSIDASQPCRSAPLPVFDASRLAGTPLRQAIAGVIAKGGMISPSLVAQLFE